MSSSVAGRIIRFAISPKTARSEPTAAAASAPAISAALDADGFLTLSGREKELIIRGGAKISPVEIDSCLMQCAEVIEAATDRRA